MIAPSPIHQSVSSLLNFSGGMFGNGEASRSDVSLASSVGPPSSGQALPGKTSGKSIDDYVIESEAGRGAYGLVKRARAKGPDGQAVGDQVIIKYIIKQRILADCWKKHAIFGPIPIEIHVMEQLRKVPFKVSSTPIPVPRSSEPQSGVVTEIEELFVPTDTTTSMKLGHPNIAKMLDFFEDKDYYYLVLECFGIGQDLFDFV